jgi:hypothetical protein
MTSLTDYNVRIKKYEPSDPRLGRHVRHDSRSLLFQVEAEKLSTLKSIRHKRYIPILDQGDLGSCTGNAGTGVLGTGVFWNLPAVKALLSMTDAAANERVAVGVYAKATLLDPFSGSYPPTDTGSDGLSVAKVLQKMGLISGYQHATSLEAVLTALSKQPVMIGTEWRGDMFNPDADGRIRITGSVEGGHEYELDELDVGNRCVWLDNSWTTGWGVEGRAYITWDDLGTLLSNDGDCTVFTPATVPAPTPTPTPPAPTPTPPAPTPTPTPPAPTPPAPPAPVDPTPQFVSDAQAFQKSLDSFITWYNSHK